MHRIKKVIELAKSYLLFVCLLGICFYRFSGAAGKFPAKVRENCRCSTPKNKKPLRGAFEHVPGAFESENEDEAPKPPMKLLRSFR